MSTAAKVAEYIIYKAQKRKNPVTNTIKTNNVTIAVPQLGCGLGGLEWKRVLNLIRKYLGPVQHITFYIYGPRL